VKKCVLVLMVLAAPAALAEEKPELLTAADLPSFGDPPVDHRILYGDDPLQFADLRLPPGDGPHPVAVFVHGGCWLADYDITHSGKLTAALARAGIATWSLEYRRVGDEGGSWPGTFADVARGAAHLRTVAADHDLDLDRVIVAGHSAGGHLALWLASETVAEVEPAELPDWRGVLALAPAADLGFLHEQGTCGDVVDALLGGGPADHPDRYDLADPVRFAAGDAPRVVLTGLHDEMWTPPGLRYLEAVAARGEEVRHIVADESGHFEMIDPDSSTWPLVLGAARELLGLETESQR
jgi:acetyl esterase/lipase